MNLIDRASKELGERNRIAAEEFHCLCMEKFLAILSPGLKETFGFKEMVRSDRYVGTKGDPIKGLLECEMEQLTPGSIVSFGESHFPHEDKIYVFRVQLIVTGNPDELQVIFRAYNSLTGEREEAITTETIEEMELTIGTVMLERMGTLMNELAIIKPKTRWPWLKFLSTSCVVVMLVGGLSILVTAEPSPLTLMMAKVGFYGQFILLPFHFLASIWS